MPRDTHRQLLDELARREPPRFDPASVELTRRQVTPIPTHAGGVRVTQLLPGTGREPGIPIEAPLDKLARIVHTAIDPIEGFSGPGGADRAVTQFIRRGVPSKALRARGTKDFVERAKQMFPEALHKKIDEFAARFPRVSAHAELSDDMVGADGFDGVTRWSEEARAATRSSPIVGVLDKGRTRIPVGLRADPDLELLAHEISHVSQALGSSRTPRLYSMSSDYLADQAGKLGTTRSKAAEFAYANNPYEESAYSIARRKMLGSTEPPVSVPRRLSELTTAQVEKGYDSLGRRRITLVPSHARSTR